MILAHVTVPVILYGLFPQLNLLVLLIGANVSSFDALPTLIRKKVPDKPIEETHAATVLHTLFFFILLFFPIYIWLGFQIALSFTVGGFTHVLIDALDEKGRMLLYPISKRFYGPKLFTYDFWTYVTDKRIFALESSLFIVSCVILLL
ncbi:MAG: metal-dependent hydrolase [Candidatus Hadarchaeales archaeon]